MEGISFETRPETVLWGAGRNVIIDPTGSFTSNDPYYGGQSSVFRASKVAALGVGGDTRAADYLDRNTPPLSVSHCVIGSVTEAVNSS